MLDSIKPNAARTKSSVLLTNVILSIMQFDVGFIEYSMLSSENKNAPLKKHHTLSIKALSCVQIQYIY